MSLTESVVEIAVEEARKHGGSRILRVTLEVGALSHAEPEALQFCFQAVSAGTTAEGATLFIEEIPGAGWCLDCAKTVPLAERFGVCPECGASHVQMTAGGEMKIREVEIG